MNQYRASMSMAKAMLEKGIITEKEYYKIDEIIAEKYGINLDGLWGRDPLIYNKYRGNMSPNIRR